MVKPRLVAIQMLKMMFHQFFRNTRMSCKFLLLFLRSQMNYNNKLSTKRVKLSRICQKYRNRKVKGFLITTNEISEKNGISNVLK